MLAFLTDDWDTVAVRLHQTEKTVVADVIGGSADPVVLQHQVARMLSIDVDGGPFDALQTR